MTERRFDWHFFVKMDAENSFLIEEDTTENPMQLTRSSVGNLPAKYYRFKVGFS